MELNLEGKTAVVCGSSRGIGKSIAYGLLREGAEVYITGRDPETLDFTYNEFKAEFAGRVNKYCGDLTKTDEIKRLLTSVMDKHGRLDIAVANIGLGKSKPGWDVEDGIWEESFEVNFFSAVRFSREAVRVMQERREGSIILIASIAGCEAIPAPVQYSSAKSAMLSYMKNTANIIAGHGIRMNAVSPGNIFFEGGTWDRKIKENKPAVEEYLNEAVPLKRLGKPEEIADTVCFLASARASFITGANFIVDGGQTRRII